MRTERAFTPFPNLEVRRPANKRRGIKNGGDQLIISPIATPARAGRARIEKISSHTHQVRSKLGGQKVLTCRPQDATSQQLDSLPVPADAENGEMEEMGKIEFLTGPPSTPKGRAGRKYVGLRIPHRATTRKSV
ncbi:MAG: hypothetical protein ALECFALPRED_002142 [Alectoria fallacina]|uniref:Uncharacterized protein n=1 Tax=Alectoria fallacina TaxID=1903189 RepID=A0A8H3IJ11_9LECA|nr:MAG: hypothetical protein ALECFALPRED_002142 [Alectoria fallacina]